MNKFINFFLKNDQNNNLIYSLDINQKTQTLINLNKFINFELNNSFNYNSLIFKNEELNNLNYLNKQINLFFFENNKFKKNDYNITLSQIFLFLSDFKIILYLNFFQNFEKNLNNMLFQNNNTFFPKKYPHIYFFHNLLLLIYLIEKKNNNKNFSFEFNDVLEQEFINDCIKDESYKKLFLLKIFFNLCEFFEKFILENGENFNINDLIIDENSPENSFNVSKKFSFDYICNNLWFYINKDLSFFYKILDIKLNQTQFENFDKLFFYDFSIFFKNFDSFSFIEKIKIKNKKNKIVDLESNKLSIIKLKKQILKKKKVNKKVNYLNSQFLNIKLQNFYITYHSKVSQILFWCFNSECKFFKKLSSKLLNNINKKKTLINLELDKIEFITNYNSYLFFLKQNSSTFFVKDPLFLNIEEIKKFKFDLPPINLIYYLNEKIIVDNIYKNNKINYFYYVLSLPVIQKNKKNIFNTILNKNIQNFFSAKLKINFIFNDELVDFTNKIVLLENFFFEEKIFFSENDLIIKICNNLNNLNCFFLDKNINFPEYNYLVNCLNLIKNKKEIKNKIKFFLILIKKFNDDLINANSFVKNNKIFFKKNNFSKLKINQIQILYSKTSQIFSEYLFYNQFFKYCSFFYKKNTNFIFQSYLDFRGRIYNFSHLFSPTGNKWLRHFFLFDRLSLKEISEIIKYFDYKKFFIFKYNLNLVNVYELICKIFDVFPNKNIFNFKKNDLNFNFIKLNSIFWLLVSIYKFFLLKQETFSYINIDINLYNFLEKNYINLSLLANLLKLTKTDLIDCKNTELNNYYLQIKKIFHLNDEDFFEFFNNFIFLYKTILDWDFLPNNYIFKDASANVYQHIILMSNNQNNNTDILKNFNLIENTKATDPYQFLIEYININDEVLKNFKDIFPEFFNFKKNDLNFLFSRKFLKKILMTYYYKSTKYNWELELTSSKDYKNFQENLFSFYLQKEFFQETEEIQKKLNNFLDCFLNLIKKKLENFDSLFDFNISEKLTNFIKLKKIEKITDLKLKLVFEDLVVDLLYFIVKELQLKTSKYFLKNNKEKNEFNNVSYDPKITYFEEKIDFNKILNSIIANMIHSIDARIVRIMFLKNIPIISIHDCFGTYPFFQDLLIENYKCSLNEFYKNEYINIINYLFNEINIENKIKIKVKPIVVDSDYCII